MSIRLLEPAQTELDEAIAWYAGQAPGLGDVFLIETLKALQLINRFPQAWHPLTPQIRRRFVVAGYGASRTVSSTPRMNQTYLYLP